jgi:malate dehydrogenase
VYLPGVPGGEEIAQKTGVDYFSVPVELGLSGTEKATNPLSSMNAHEKRLVEICIAGLKGNIEKGIEFVKNPPQK